MPGAKPNLAGIEKHFTRRDFQRVFHLANSQRNLSIPISRSKTLAIIKMSDYEDEMDVDAPAVKDSVLFSSDNTSKGKRSAANLPVEAEDSLPW